MVVYVCMLSAMLLVGLVSSALGFGSANAEVQVLVDDNIVWESGPVPGGWDWYEINVDVSAWSGQDSTITIRWITTDGTVGVFCFDNLRLGENILDNFESPASTGTSATVNGWKYEENDTDNVLSLQIQTDHVKDGQYGWEFNASANTAAGNVVQITKRFHFSENLTTNDNLRLWTWSSWDLREVSDVISQITTYAVALLVVYLHVSRFERRKLWSSVGVKREGMLKSVIWVFALWVVFTVILSIYPQSSAQGFFATSPDWYFIYLGFAFFIPVAFTEELVFRGFMISRFSVKGAVKAIVLSSALFTFLHLWYWSFGIEQALLNYSGLFLLAIWWGIVYWKTRNIFGLILAHGIYNFGMVAEHFWPGGGVVLGSSVFMVGVACLGYLAFIYLKNMFIEMETLVKKKP